MIKFFLIFLICALWCVGAIGQQAGPIGTWKSYLPRHQGKAVVQTKDKVVYASDWNLIVIDPADLSAEFMSKTNGLSDIGIQSLGYDPFNDQLFVLYENSNIDVVQKSRVVNVSNIAANNTISGDRKLYHVHFVKDDLCYISAGFGIIAFDPLNFLFGSTTFTSVKVNQSVTHGDFLYALTEDGLYSISTSSASNLSDFSQWSLRGVESGLPGLYRAVAATVRNDELYLATESALYKASNDGSFTEVFRLGDPAFETSFLSSAPSGLLMGLKGDAFSIVLLVSDAGAVLMREDSCPTRVRGATIGPAGRIWYADEFNDIKYSEVMGEDCRRLNFDSPYFTDIGEVKASEGKILVASGGVSENFNYLFSRRGFYLFDNNRWTNYNEFLDNRLGQLDLLSVHRIIAHPSQDKLYAGSYWAGLAEYTPNTDQFVLYNKENSSLRGAVGDEARERVSALAFDKNENLWVAAYGSPKPLNVLTDEGTWHSFSTGAQTSIIDLTVDFTGYVWAPVYGNNGGILVYDPGASVEDASDDRIRLINRSNSELTTNTVNTIEVDRNGVVWAGTAEGPVLFDCGEAAFDGSCMGVRRKVLEDSIAAFLLADQDIRAIAFDGADRKWFGTRNGVFVQSPDGVESVERFTAENSSLFDNQVISMAYRELNGEMLIGTAKGLIGYQTATSIGEPIHRKDKVVVYPNPVRPDYEGLIAVKGLVEDARVKITDVNGYLVFETRALGGTATWDGKNNNGQRVSSGVYLVFSTEEDTFDSPDSFVTKILIVR